jgi:23S rRNA pseudouridine1911/1915/1917 synthase
MMQNSEEIEDEIEEAEAAEEATSQSPELLQYRATANEAGQRLDVVITSLLTDGSRSEAKRLIEMPDTESSGVRVDGKREKAGYKVKTGNTIEIVRSFVPQTYAVLPEAIPLSIIYEDSDLLVIDKARGMVVHPAPGAERGTLVNAVLAHANDLSGIGGELRPGIVHRLDKDTGGLIMVAKNDAAHRALQSQIESRTAERRYQAIIWGVPKFEHAKIEAPIGRHPADRKKMAVITDPRQTARSAVTELFVKATYDGTFALVEAKLHTGRTHQIRVHCAYIHHPIVGDPLYGGMRKVPSTAYSASQQRDIETAIDLLGGQALHAYSLAFNHPRTDERLAFTVPLPAPMQNLLDILREQ